jgi:hypothetical protein
MQDFPKKALGRRISVAKGHESRIFIIFHEKRFLNDDFMKNDRKALLPPG